MRILWIINSPFPEVYEELKQEAPVTVGWVDSAANGILSFNSDVYLGVASFFDVDKLTVITKEKKVHFLLPSRLRNKPETAELMQMWLDIKMQFRPDVTHIHGTEYPHSYSYVRACGNENVVISIQGLVSVYERYYYGHISNNLLLKTVTLRDVVKFDTIFRQRRKMRSRAVYEQKVIGLCKHIVGRTSWDKDHTWAINPDASYHFCNETLRSAFYENSWKYDNCEKHSIFVSQAHYPIKGFHQLVKALPIILSHFPETKVYVAGHNFFSNRGIKIHGFGKLINTYIKKHKLEDKIIFTGLLSEEGMCDRFLKSHVFVCPSAIENSPNSVGEAQLLGVPCVASYVGGTMDMVEHEKTGLLYRFEETEMLAASICKLFSDSQLAIQLSDGGKRVARERHHKEKNALQLHSIYLSASQD